MLAALIVIATLAAPPTDLEAAGVVVHPSPGRSVALLRSGGRTRAAALGETAFGGRIVAITPGQVALEYDSGRLELKLPAAISTSLPVPAPVAARLGALDEADVSSRVMARRDVERRLAEEIPRILAETTLLPVADEGQVRGMALTRIPEGTLLSDAGLRPGDVLTRVNGVAVDGLATLVGLWPRLQGESELRAEVLRNGRVVSLTVTLR